VKKEGKNVCTDQRVESLDGRERDAGGEVEGKYRDASGTFNAEFKDGKAYIAMGAYAVDGTYKIEGNKLIATGDFGMMLPHTIAFTILSDGTLDPPRDTPIPRLEKVKK
jgi:hypothetical protein